MRKILSVALTTALLFTGLGAAASAAKPAEKPAKPQLELKEKGWSVLEVYDENGKVISETIKLDEGTNQEDISAEAMEAGNIEEADIGTEAYVDPGSMNYAYLDTWYGTSYLLDSTADWAAKFLVAAIPIGLSANPWASAAGLSAFDAFYNPPATRYYKNVIYQAKDSYYYYGKVTDYEYSDSARTKLTRKNTYYRTTPRQ